MERFYSLLTKILKDGIEVNLYQLEEICNLSDDHLGNLESLSKLFNKYDLEISPPLNTGDFKTKRNLRAKNFDIDLDSLVQVGETHNQEFKSTAFCDTKKRQHAPNQAPGQYYSDHVLNSALKTIAAFANSDGGTLLIGVTDEGDIYGINNEFDVINVNNNDGWELLFRSKIDSLFIDGKSMNSFLKIEFCNKDEKTVAVIKVASREKLGFLTYQGTNNLYLRQGNRSIKVEFQNIESYFNLSKLN